jgi:hypothetical protein
MSQGITQNQLAEDVVTVFKKAVTLTNAQVLALPTTPVEIIPALAGQIILPINATLVLNSAAGLYGNVALTDDGGITALYPLLGSPVFGVVPSDLMASGLTGGPISLWLTPVNNSAFEAGDADVLKDVVSAGRAESSTSAANFVGQPFRLVVDNYSADYETDRGNFTGGHPANSLTITVEYMIISTGPTKAFADIGAGANGTVQIAVDLAGDAGNDYSIHVVVGVGNDVAMSAALVGTAITVTLGTDGSADPDDTKNTATLIAAAVNALSGITSQATGTGADALDTAAGPSSFTGGAD